MYLLTQEQKDLLFGDNGKFRQNIPPLPQSEVERILNDTLGLTPLPAGTVGKIGREIVEECAKKIAPAKRVSNQTVLGRYPDYVKLSDELGARRFNIPSDVWNKMTPAQQWNANRKFLDRMISKGDEILLSNPANKAPPGSFFGREINYLKNKGYQISGDGLRMIPGL